MNSNLNHGLTRAIYAECGSARGALLVASVARRLCSAFWCQVAELNPGTPLVQQYKNKTMTSSPHLKVPSKRDSPRNSYALISNLLFLTFHFINETSTQNDNKLAFWFTHV